MITWLAVACGSPAPERAQVAPIARTTTSAESDRSVVGVSATSSQGDRVVLARWREGALGSEVVAVDRGVERVLVDEGWNADRPALSDDGSRVAFVSGKTGIASIWVVPFAGGAPVQVTNVGLVRHKGERGAPEGFVPVPADTSLRFDGDALVWTAPQGQPCGARSEDQGCRAELP